MMDGELWPDHTSAIWTSFKIIKASGVLFW